jgi:2-succinyl-6-hydroxy-2,4-cyclohexadiene-1-carboxylate synthase
LSEEARRLSRQLLPKTLPFKSTLLGYSYGGRVALEFCLQNPGHFSKLILVSTAFGLCGTKARAERAESDEKWARIFLEKPWEECLKLWSSQEILSSTGDVLGSRDEALYSRERLAEALRLRGQSKSPFYLPRLGELNLPVLLVVGDQDEKYVRAADEALTQFRTAQVIKLKGASHRACFQQPGPFLDALKSFIFS